jgi:iron complex outermembrane receptor protein
MISSLKPLPAALLVAGLVTAGVSARAQDAASATPVPASTPSATDAHAEQTVVITGGKRREMQREIAGTVTALGGAQLEEAGAKDLEDIFKLAPGVQLNKADPDHALPTIRGVGTTTNAATLVQQATTGIYIDDVPFTDPWGFVTTADLAPFDLQGVEVLRGPQGALYGSASLGGALLYVLNRPSTKSTDFSVLANASTVSHGGAGGSLYAMVNKPLSKNAAVRAVVFDRYDSGYIDNIGTGNRHANDLHQRGGRVLGEVKLTPAVTVTGAFLTQRTSTGDGFGVSPDPSQLRIDTPTPSTRTSQFSLGYVKVEADLGRAMFTSLTAHTDKKSDAATDLTRRAGNIGALVDPTLPAFPSVESDSAIKGAATSQEFRIASTGDAPLSYVAGVFLQRSTYDLDARWVAPGGATSWGTFGTLLPSDTVLHEVDDATAIEAAAFADAEYRFANGFSLGLGGREYHNKVHFDVDSVLLTDPLLNARNQSQNGFTPKASVKYRFGDQMWYALASKGYRFGGVNLASDTAYKSDSLWNYETGLRLAPSHDLHIDLSAFYIDWKDVQLAATIKNPQGVPFNGIANVGKASIKGLEASLNWRALPSLSLAGTLAYTDAATDAPFTASNGTVVRSGTALPGTARFQSSLQGSWYFPGPLQTQGRFDLVHSFLGKRALTIDNGGVEPAYHEFDSRVVFTLEHWEIGAFVDNIADKRGVAGGQQINGIGSPNYTDWFLIKPRTFGLSLRYDL